MNWKEKQKVNPQVICGECDGTPEEAMLVAVYVIDGVNVVC